jgi:hypothetical protein
MELSHGTSDCNLTTFATVPNFITVSPLKRKLSRRTKNFGRNLWKSIKALTSFEFVFWEEDRDYSFFGVTRA